ncbi:MAG: riboflavin synthase, partial [Spirochaetota bacterium]
MFTGLIEETGTVSSLRKEGSGYILSVKGSAVMEGLKTGDSVAVDGVCQTVVSVQNGIFSVFMSEVTASLTTLSSKKAGDSVNLERAMIAGGRFGGHIVQGHVDGKGKIHDIARDAQGIRFRIKAPAALLKYIAAKGSVCIDGVSLTVVDQQGDFFDLYIIPESVSRTTL